MCEILLRPPGTVWPSRHSRQGHQSSATISDGSAAGHDAAQAKGTRKMDARSNCQVKESDDTPNQRPFKELDRARNAPPCLHVPFRA